MNLKHNWTPQEAHVISGLKRLLTQKSFAFHYTQTAARKICLSFQQGILCQMHLDGKTPDLVHAWEQMLDSPFLDQILEGKMLVHGIMLAQAIIYLFSSSKKIEQIETLDKVGKFLFDNEPQFCASQARWRLSETAASWSEKHNAPWIYIDPLPVRLQPDFMKKVRERDIAQLLFLLDMTTPGEKPKNICTYLLNNDDYEGILAFGDPAQNLAKLDRSKLKHFWLNCMDQTEAEKKFSHAIYPLLDFRLPWEELHDAKRMSAKLDVMLDFGISPDLKVFNKTDVRIPLKKYLYFLDEIKEEVSQGLGNCYTLRDDLTAAAKFIEREQKNSDTGH